MVDQILREARKDLLKYKHIEPALFMHIAPDHRTVLMLEKLPRTPEGRHAYLRALGQHIRSRGDHVLHAMILMETWFVQSEALMNVMPSQHADRKSAISLFGRNDLGTHQTYVIHPFAWFGDKLVFEDIAHEAYDEGSEDGQKGYGLLDALFR